MSISEKNPRLSQLCDELRDHIVRLLKQTAHLRTQIEANEFELYQYVREHRRISKDHQSRECV
jgi:hypothetical protein